MAFEHGSLDLGIRNPFRFEGTLKAARGLITTVMGLLVLLSVPELIQEQTTVSKIFGWIATTVAFILLSNGLWVLGKGLMQCLRFFVGRSVPTSLAYNQAKSEADSANRERADVAYDADQLEQMLIGRKNLTFTEPQGLINRLIHTLFPKLTLAPYPIRNMAAQLSDAIAKTILAIVAYLLASFVISSGLIGPNGPFIQPLVSSLFLINLVFIWIAAGRPISRQATHSVISKGAAGISRTIIAAITFPIAASYLVDMFLDSVSQHRAPQWLQPIETITVRGDMELVGLVQGIYNNVSIPSWIMIVAALGIGSFALIAFLIAKRCEKTSPITEVSELRENWQESVHPREIFINLDSMVMANRRYKEVPNRVYRSMKPMLQEQTNGKGAFYGETIQETQPSVRPVAVVGVEDQIRKAATVIGQSLLLGGSLLLFINYEIIFTLINKFTEIAESSPTLEQALANTQMFGSELAIIINSVIGLAILACFGRLLGNFSHVFWSEFQFESQLIYFKCEGTFTESTIATGKGIYDSTQSENVIVRSSMTPWVVVSKLVTSTFAGVGSKNLEQPRHIMALHSNDNELLAITNDLKGYLASRQTIANVNTEADLLATSQINELNQQSRSLSSLQLKDPAPAALAGAATALENKEGN
ncbi:hypothetical protein [Paraferrimonas sp. SM1919]|uniref:hypothetical protein n=1 Tax=Paraferrimonas sp. SM1919 TaxID=2662263 RepID=UPI0013D11534|nr:hypothetical protein [Paraferrimonas sp. SM1919]